MSDISAANIHARALDAYIALAVDGLAQSVEWVVDQFGDASAVSSVTGYAFRFAGKPDVYVARGLIESEYPMLSFIPTTLGQRPPDGSRVTFGGERFYLHEVIPFSPGGVDVSHRVLVRR